MAQDHPSSTRARMTPVPTASLIESGTIRPAVEKVVPFDSTKEAIALVEGGHAKGKVVISMT